MTRLTQPQFDELDRQEDEPQPCYGAARTRVQNALVARGLSVYLDDDGETTTSEFAAQCLITEAGHTALEEERQNRLREREASR